MSKLSNLTLVSCRVGLGVCQHLPFLYPTWCELQAAAREALSLMDKQINELYPAIQNVLIFLSFVFVVSISPLELETQVREVCKSRRTPI